MKTVWLVLIIGFLSLDASARDRARDDDAMDCGQMESVWYNPETGECIRASDTCIADEYKELGWREVESCLHCVPPTGERGRKTPKRLAPTTFDSTSAKRSSMFI